MKKTSLRLLLLEDNPGDVRLIREYLGEDETMRFEVKQVPRLGDGLVMLAEHKPDIILVDLELSDSQGLDTFLKLKTRAALVPIVVLTGMSNISVATQAVQAGAQDFLSKDDLTSNLLRRSLRYALERYKTDQAMRESAAQWQTTFNATSDGICILDTEWNIIRTNLGMQTLFQKRQEEMLGKKLWEITHSSKKPPKDCPTMGLNKDSTRVMELIHRDNHWVEMTADPFLDSSGDFIGTVHNFRDVTERRNTEQAILRMADTQRQIALLENVHKIYELVGSRIQELIGDGYVAVSQLDQKSQHMHVVGFYGFGDQFDQLVEKFKFDPHMMSFPISEIPAEDLLLFKSNRLESYKDGIYGLSIKKIHKRICALVEKELKLTGVYYMGFVWEDTHYGGVAILAKNDLAPFKEMIETIINQAAMAIKRIQSEQAFQESEFHLRESQRVSRIGSYTMDLKADVWVSSEVLDELFGIQRDSEKNTASWNELIHPDERNIMLNYFLQDVIAARNPFNREYRIIRPSDGEVRWVWGLGSLTYAEDGTPLKMIGTIQDVTERKQADLEIQESHSLLAATIESTADGILVVDLEGRIRLTNGKFAELWGIPKQVLDKHDDATALDFVMDQLKDPSGFISKVKALYETPWADSFDEIEFKDKRVFERVSHPQLQGEQIVGRVWIFRDVTERKQAEVLEQAVYQIALAAESTRLLDDLYPTIHQIISSVMPSENFYITLYDERQGVLTFPYFKDSQDEPLLWGEVQPGHGLTAYVLRTGKSLLCTQEIHDELERKGEIKLLGVPSAIWLGVPLIVESKVIGVMVVQHYTDASAYSLREQHMLEFVSSQVAIVISRKQAEQALHESETQYQTVVEQLPAIVYIDDITKGPGHTVYVSPQIETILGVTQEEWMKGDLDVWLDHTQPGDRDRILEEYMRCFHEGEPINSEYCMLASDGRLVWILDQAQLLRDENGKPHSIHGIMYDITQRKQAEILQQAVYKIALATETTRSLDDLYPIIHEIIASVMLSENFYITLYNEERNTLYFPYFKDEVDEPYIGEMKPGLGLTNYVLRTGKSLLCDQELHDELERKGEIKLLGVPSAIWLGVPLIADGKVIGAMVVQHYSDPKAYGLHEQQMLEFVSSQVAIAISRKQSEQALAESESELRALFTAMPDLILVLDKDGRYLKIASGNPELLYQPAEEVIGKTLHEIFPIEKADQFQGYVSDSLENKQTVSFEYELQINGRSTWFNGTISPMTEDNVIWIARDITEKKHTNDLILESETKYRSLFENVPDGVYRTTPEGKILTVNQEMVRMLGFASINELMNTSVEDFYINIDDRKEFTRLMDEFGEVHNLEVILKNKAGRSMVMLENARAFRDENKTVLFYEGTLTDITERKRSETERQTLLEIIQGLMITDDLHDYLQVVHQALARVIYAENFFVILLNKETGLFEQAYLADKIDLPVSPSELGKSLSAYVYRTGRPFLFDQATFDLLVSQGEVEQVGASSPSWLGVPLIASRETIGVLVIQDYETENRYVAHDVEFLSSIAGQVALAVKRKNAETELARMLEREKRRVVRLSELQVIGAELNSLHTQRELMQTLVRRAAELSNSPVCTIMMLDEITSEVILSEHTGLPNSTPPGLRIPIQALPQEVMVFQKGDPVIISNIDQDLPSLRRVLLHPDIQSFTAYPLTIDGRVEGVFTLSNIVPHRPSEAEINAYQLLARLASAALDNVRLFESINRSIKRLGSLRRVDMAISSSFDLMLTLNTLLEQVTNHLEVDAADVLVFDQGDSTLKYTCGRGFHSQALKYTNLRLGEGHAGRAALERRTIHIPNIQIEQGGLDKSTSLGSEEFVCYWGVPLLGKGHIQGVLEVFHRQPLVVDQEWLDFLETLAGQAAIAIDNVRLFDHLERSNADLSMAYDSTLAGWASALEMRDNETQGHTRRVATMTMKLAGRLGMHDQDVMFLRWGSLLHDIGKMGIPDNILLKPGPLTDEEWVIMRKHPSLAYEMLSPISYLREALDIPYCHHEKWDGTGYPRQLKGEQIPITARIFAIVDVWDALISDRPYRKAWTLEKTLEYIREQDGIHFDPKVVRAFLELMESESQTLT